MEDYHSMHQVLLVLLAEWLHHNIKIQVPVTHGKLH
jgi:hypothetical protein